MRSIITVQKEIALMEKVELTPEEKRFIELNRDFIRLVSTHYFLRFNQFEIVEAKIISYQIDKANLKEK